MPPSGDPLPARTQQLVSVLLASLAFLAVLPVLDVLVYRWPFHPAEAAWRYQTFLGVFASAPQFVVLLCLIAAIGAFDGNRLAVRAAAIATAAMAIVLILVIPFFGLDLLTVRRMMPQDYKRSADMVAVKNVVYSTLLIMISGWAALRGWQASAPVDRTRRDKGDGLVVGQAE